MRALAYWTAALAIPALLVAASAAAQPAPPGATPEPPPPLPAAPSASPDSPPSAERPTAPPPPAAAPPPAQTPPPPTPWYPVPPPQQILTPPPADHDPPPSRDMSRDFWQLTGGARVSWVGSEAYDPFADNDALPQLSLAATRALLFAGDMSFAAGVTWEVGTTASSARGADTEMTVHRFGGVAEGRYHFGRDVYGLLKLVPQAIHTRASIDEASSPASLKQKAWNFGLDATVGAAWNVPRTFGSRNVIPQFWLIGEFGYGWAPTKDLELSPDVDEDDPQARIQMDLGPLDLRGVMMRLNVAITF